MSLARVLVWTLVAWSLSAGATVAMVLAIGAGMVR